jgi:hypothetical protein
MRPGKSSRRGLSQVKTATRALQYDAYETGYLYPNVAAGGALLNPYNTATNSPLLWWDFTDYNYIADGSGITIPDGGQVYPGGPFSYIFDKSGNGYTGSVTGTVTWETWGGINGRPSAYSNGTGHIISDGAMSLAVATIMVVYVNDEWQTGSSPYAGNRNLYHTDLPPTGSSNFGVRFEQGSNSATLYLGNATSNNGLATGITSKGTSGIGIHFIKLFPGLPTQVRHNGVWGTPTSTPNLASTFCDRFAVFTGFSQSDADRKWKGRIGEVIVWPDVLADWEIEQVESFMLDKYGASKYRNSVGTELSPIADPNDLGIPCSLWLDASTASTQNMTVSATNPNLVETWKNKGNAAPGGSNFSAIGFQRPTTLGLQFGSSVKNVLVFNGVNNCLNSAANIMCYANLTVFAFAYRSGGTYGGIITSATNADSSPGLQIDTNNITIRGFQNSAYGGAYTGPAVISATVDAGAASIFLNGVQVGSTSAATGSLNGATTTTIGNARTVLTPGNFLAGYIGEIIVYPSVLSAADRNRVERYLRNKWLPAGSLIPEQTFQVGAWKDLSSQNIPATQSLPANKPVFQYDATTLKGSLAFDTSDELLPQGVSISSFLKDAPSAPKTAFFFVAAPSTQTGNVAFGCNPNANAASRVFFSSKYGTAIILDIGSAIETTGGRLTAPYEPYTTAPRVWCCYRNGSNMAIRRDGVVIASTTTASGGFTSTSAFFSIGKADGAFSSGSFMEWIAYNGVPSDADIRAIERYLSSKWLARLAPIVGNTDAQDWINRVYKNGGEVSNATADAVNNFCNAIDGYGLRTKFLRLNLFAGTGINAVTTPLYLSGVTGTVYGNTTDLAVGSPSFITADYNETGVNGGLLGAAGKFLNTGVPTNTMSAGNRHLAAYVKSPATGLYQEILGSESAATVGSNQFVLGTQTLTDKISFRCGSLSSAGAIAPNAVSTGAFWIGSSPTTTTADLFQNGQPVATGQATTVGTPDSSSIFIMAMNRSGGSATDYFLGRLAGYSIGTSLSSTDAANYNTAMQAFQLALGRNV